MRRTDSSHVTLRMVAEAAGVSVSTASRVMNDATNVSDGKRVAVKAAAARLGFVLNGIAKALVDGRTRTVGLIAQHFESPFDALLLRGIEENLSRAGYALVVSSGHWNPGEEAHCVQVLRTRQVDGIIVLGGSLDDRFLTGLAAELPIVLTGRDLKAPGLHALRSNDYSGALAATRYLLQLGHRRIAHVAGDSSHPDSHDRERGYRAALEEAHVAFDPDLVWQGNYHESSGTEAVESLLQRGIEFTAVFAANDQMAGGATLAVQRHGLCVPEDISIVGFDDLLATKHASPPRTTVNLSVIELGRRAASAMLDLLSHRRPNAVAPEPELIVRNSTAPRSARQEARTRPIVGQAADRANTHQTV